MKKIKKKYSDDRPYLQKGLKSKQMIFSLPEILPATSASVYALIKKHETNCPICGMPWPEKFELNTKTKNIGISLPIDLVEKLKCFESANNFVRTLIESDRGLCPACKQ